MGSVMYQQAPYKTETGRIISEIQRRGDVMTSRSSWRQSQGEKMLHRWL